MPYKVKGKCVYKKDTNKKVGCTKGSVKKYLSALHANADVNESESEFDWVDLISPNIVPGKQYYVKTNSGYWTPIEYCGEGTTTNFETNEKIMGHRFKDIHSENSKCNEWWSDETLKSKIDKGLIKEYDPSWSVMDDIEFGSLSDINGRNFVIYFENGVDMDDTIDLQKRLFDMGYHFYGRGGEFKPFTSKDTKGKNVIMFECINWDTSNEVYSKMPSNMRDEGNMSIVADKPKDDWGSMQKKDSFYLQERFRIVIDHNAIVVDGYPLLGGEVINESDFDWTDDIPIKYIKTTDLEVGKEYIARNLHVRRLNGGESFDAEGKRFVVTNIRKHPYIVEILWTNLDDGIDRVDWFSTLSAGDWEPFIPNKEINESDFDWIKTIISDDPIKWVQPDVTIDNVERDEDGWPLYIGDGSGEIWIDVERFNNDERHQILRNIEKHLGSLWFDFGSVSDSESIKKTKCASSRKGFILHCGHEDNHFFSQENHVCCMGITYNEFMDYEHDHSETEVKERPIVDGGLFLKQK